MPRFYGSPTPKAAALIKDRESLVSAIRARDEKAYLGITNAGTHGFLDFNGGIRVNQFDGFTSYLEAVSKKVWASTRAVDIVANVALSTEMSIVHRDKDKRKARKPVNPNPGLLRLLANPNPYDTISEAIYLWVAHMKFTGNALWFKDEMNGYGIPNAIYPLYPNRIEIKGSKDKKISKYVYRVNSGEVEFDPEEIIHWKRPHPNNSLLGLGDVQQGETLYDDFINRTAYNVRFMENGGIPASILVKDDGGAGVDQADWEKMKEAFIAKFGGVKNAGKVGFLNGKWSLLELGIDAQKMQDLEKSKLNVEQIILNHGVPLSVFGLGAANYATSRQDRINFRSDTVLPLLNWFCDRMNGPGGLVTIFHPDLKLDFNLSGLIDREQVAKECEPMVRSGAMTPNQFREEMGYPTENNPYLDQYFIQQGLVPIEVAGIATEPAGTPQPKPAPRIDDGEPPRKKGEPKPDVKSEPVVVNIYSPPQAAPQAPAAITINPQPSAKAQRVEFQHDERGRTVGAKLVPDDKAA